MVPLPRSSVAETAFATTRIPSTSSRQTTDAFGSASAPIGNRDEPAEAARWSRRKFVEPS